MNELTTKEREVPSLTANDFKGKVDPDWCPGCGDFGVLNSLKKACVELGLQPHDILKRQRHWLFFELPGYFNAYGMHTLHGRSLAVATGAKMANHEMTVIVTAATVMATESAATISHIPRGATST